MLYCRENIEFLTQGDLFRNQNLITIIQHGLSVFENITSFFSEKIISIMRIIDRLNQYLSLNKITAYSFEKTCQVGNGYLKKQLKGKGSIGSDILEKIYKSYFDLSILWLITGQGEMHRDPNDQGAHFLQEEKRFYSKDEEIRLLTERIRLLESSLSDKEKIIALLELKSHPKN